MSGAGQGRAGQREVFVKAPGRLVLLCFELQGFREQCFASL